MAWTAYAGWKVTKGWRVVINNAGLRWPTDSEAAEKFTESLANALAKRQTFDASVMIRWNAEADKLEIVSSRKDSFPRMIPFTWKLSPAVVSKPERFNLNEPDLDAQGKG